MAVANGVFSMKLDSEKKVLVAFAEGMFNLEKGGEFCKAFIDAAKKASQFKDYSLIVDVSGVKPTSPEVQEQLVEVMSLYASKDFVFKKRFMTKLASAVTQSQANRLAKGTPGFSEMVTFVKDQEEAFAQI